MPDLIRTFSERGDLAHLALFLWAASATALAELRAARTRRRDAPLRRFRARAFALQRPFRRPKVMDTLHTVLRSIRGETKTPARPPLRVPRIPRSPRPRRQARATPRASDARRRASGDAQARAARPSSLSRLPGEAPRASDAWRAGTQPSMHDSPGSHGQRARTRSLIARCIAPHGRGEDEGTTMLAPITNRRSPHVFAPRTTIDARRHASKATPACSARSTRRATW